MWIGNRKVNSKVLYKLLNWSKFSSNKKSFRFIFEDVADRTSYNIIIDGRNFFDQLVKKKSEHIETLVKEMTAKMFVYWIIFMSKKTTSWLQ